MYDEIGVPYQQSRIVLIWPEEIPTEREDSLLYMQGPYRRESLIHLFLLIFFLGRTALQGLLPPACGYSLLL